MSAQLDSQAADWTIGRLLHWTSEYLARHGVDEARLSAEVLLAHAAKCRRIDLYARFERLVDEPRLAQFREWVRRAAAREPIGYLVGEKEFYSLPLRVTPDVLIPRPETEAVVECAVDACTSAGLAEPRLLDLGTGSGCIVVALLVQLPGARAVATDISAAALEIARFNAERHGVMDRLELVEADRLALPRDVVPGRGFDLLVSNPPYVAADTLDQLDASIREYEPSLALSDGADGLSFYRSVASDAAGLLAPGGLVIVEVGDGQAAAVIRTVEESGQFAHRQTRKDRVVGQERVLMFALSAAT